MTPKYLRHIPSGIIHAYQDIYAVRPDFEPVVEEAVTPKVEAPTIKKTRAKKVTATVADELEDALNGTDDE